MSLENINVGDTVILESGPPYSHRYSFANVKKITPSGLIKVRGMLFYKNGMERKSDAFYSSHIYSIDDKLALEAMEHHEKQREIKKTQKRIEQFTHKEWTYEIAKKVEAFLNEIEKEN